MKQQIRKLIPLVGILLAACAGPQSVPTAQKPAPNAVCVAVDLGSSATLEGTWNGAKLIIDLQTEKVSDQVWIATVYTRGEIFGFKTTIDLNSNPPTFSGEASGPAGAQIDSRKLGFNGGASMRNGQVQVIACMNKKANPQVTGGQSFEDTMPQ